MHMKNKVKDCMSRDVRMVSPDDTVQAAAEVMKNLNVGIVPVSEGGSVVGVVTDRDIALRVVALGLDGRETKVTEAMSSPPIFCYADQDIEDAARVMEAKQIRRLIVLDGNKKPIGILALGDVAIKVGNDLSGEILEQVSEPSRKESAA
jgi:CBS domain-containing protein